MFDTTVADACEMLGIGKTRVHQLIKSGVLEAEKIGNTWLIDGRSIEARKKAGARAGRPPANQRRADDTDRFMLMNREHEVLSFRFDASTGEFFDADEVVDASRAPLSIMSPRGVRASRAELSSWWGHRSIPRARAGIEAKLRELGLPETYDLPFKCMGLSLSDQYWIRPYESNIRWKDINFFENPFHEAEIEEWLADVGLDSPDNTSDGVLSKRWVCRGVERRLLKGGSALGQEPYNEVIATELFSRRFDVTDYVPYELEEWNGGIVCSCPDLVRPHEELIPAYYVLKSARSPEHHDDYRRYVDRCISLGVEDVETALSKMIVADYILANHDRHWRNFGLIRDVETLGYRTAPLFDSGTSLWCHIPTRELEHTSFAIDAKPFYADEKRQLRLVSDDAWLDLDALIGFPEWAAELLEENPAMQGRTDFIYEGISARIDYLHTMFC